MEFLIKLRAEAYNFFEKETLAKAFSSELYEVHLFLWKTYGGRFWMPLFYHIQFLSTLDESR